jgi:hypothetical protein
MRSASLWLGCRLEQEGDPVDARRNLFEQLQPLSDYRPSRIAGYRIGRDQSADIRFDSGRLLADFSPSGAM